MYHLVYKTINLINKKIYIGVHSTENLNDGYLGSGTALKNAIKKYGKENFERHIIAKFDNPEDMFALERKLVDSDFVSNKETYNLIKGGVVHSKYKSSYFGSEEHIRNAIEVLAKNSEKANEKRNWLFENNETWSKKYRALLSEKASGEGNSQYGTVWICNDSSGEILKIRKDDLAKWIFKGWRKGRRPKI